VTDRATLEWGPGAVLGDRYELVGRAGTGGVAEVWRASDRRLGREVAVKLLSGPAAADPMQRQRIEREARALAALAHPNVVRVFDYDEEPRPGAPPVPYLVMEYVDGPNLAERLAATGACPVDEAVDVVVRVLDGVEQAHAIGIVHGDLKPGNVLLDASGEPKVGDFGVARVLAEETGTTLPVATPAYAPPEVLQGARPTAAADVYSAACIAFELITGDRPFSGTSLWETTRQHMEDEPPSLRDRLPGADVDALDAAIRRALAKRPEDRYRSASSFAAALRSAVASAPLDATAAIGSAGADTAEHEPVAETVAVAPEPTTTIAVPAAVRRRRAPAALGRLRAIPPGIVIALGAVLLLAGMRAQANATVRVPSLTGMAVERAREAASMAGFVLRPTEVAGGGKAGTVIGQDPPARALRTRGTTIDVRVTKGKPQVQIPKVAGLPSDAARNKLMDAHLVVKTVAVELDATAPLGTVLRTDPAEGTTVDEGTAVTISVSGAAQPAPPPVQKPERRGGKGHKDDQ
jgi:serine/threonine-protein kinase